MVRPNKKISLFRVTGLKIFGRVGTLIICFLGFCLSKCIKIIYFFLGFTSKLREGLVNLKHKYFLFDLTVSVTIELSNIIFVSGCMHVLLILVSALLSNCTSLLVVFLLTYLFFR